MDDCELRINHVAALTCAKPLRHALSAFLNVLEIDSVVREDVVVAVGEALANALEHAYAAREPGNVELYAREGDRKKLLVVVRDYGEFIVRDENPGRGFGLPIVRAIAQSVHLNRANGTHVQMIFDIFSSEKSDRERNALSSLTQHKEKLRY
jgi:anti-sigma regulatory factor (Ser/Thr protein kinase)